MKLPACIFLFLFTCNCMNAQQAYTVIYSKGNVFTGDKKQWNPVGKYGSKIAANLSVKLTEKSELIVSNEKNEVVRLFSAGVYAAKDFAKYFVQNNTEKESFVKYYLKYVAEQITHKEEGVEKNYKANLRNLGGVSRGNGVECLLVPLNGESKISANTKFIWRKAEANSYTLKVFSDSLLTEIVLDTTVRDTFVSVRERDNVLQQGKTYWWKVEWRGSPVCAVRAFEITMPETEAKLTEEAKQLSSESGFSPPMNWFLQAEFWKKNGKYSSAMQYYDEAVKAEPDNKLFSDARAELEKFLNNRSEQAK